MVDGKVEFLDRDRVAKAPRQTFEGRFDDVVDVATTLERDMQGNAGRLGKAGDRMFGQRRVEGRVAERDAFRQRHFPIHMGSAGEIEGYFDQRFIQRIQAAGETTHTDLVAERFTERLADGDGDIFHRVVGVDMQVANGGDRQVETAMFAKLIEHVVVKRNAGGDLPWCPCRRGPVPPGSRFPWSQRWRVAKRLIR